MCQTTLIDPSDPMRTARVPSVQGTYTVDPETAVVPNARQTARADTCPPIPPSWLSRIVYAVPDLPSA